MTVALTGERADLLESLATQHYFLRQTVRGLTDEQARLRTTASELCLGGLIKHVTRMEQRWMDFVLGNRDAVSGSSDGSDSSDGWQDQFRMLPGESLQDLLADLDEAQRRTAEIVTELPDLDVAGPLPEAPWFEPGARWSARRVLLHLIGEIAQHAGHADILRESLDGAKTMG
ncbi:Protein of unknown function (DUF664) [Saccharomonospora marina XMU15]|uniref:DinB family protein n=1 Tax=Saccharomonospora marina XMU15 TaxID=882083 RepID=H5X1P3_9PSEU|nr:DinB family protein [Saccharomonospora marina]EHR50906.1 Protein of unknown function (DUF664) [Saccharomonospora marina XMU15]